MRMAIVVLLLSLTHVVCSFGQVARAAPTVRASDASPLVMLSTSDEVARRGDRFRVWFGTAQNAYVAVFRVDTDGRVRMLFPERPWHNNYVQAGRMVEVKHRGCDQTNCAFVVDDYRGQGYIFAIANTSQFDFDAYANGDYWNYNAFAHRGRVTGDPFLALSKLIERIVPESEDGTLSYDVSEYHVEQRYEYPRFLCYDCHSFVRLPSWNPYQQECLRFRIIRYDSPAYLPASDYAPTRVVFSRSGQIAPRFVFSARTQGEPFLSIEDVRHGGGSTGSPRVMGANSRELGGVGAIPAPLGRRGTATDTDLRRLTEPDRSAREGPLSRIRGFVTTPRPQPRLLRRRQAKPDSSGNLPTPRRVRTKPDTSGTRGIVRPDEI